MDYTTYKPCPTCGVIEKWELSKSGLTYSCKHFAFKESLKQIPKDYTTQRPCSTCGVVERWERSPDGWTYSCEHFAYKLKHPSCKYCGKPDTPVRQVPAPVPFSACYCNDCWDKAKDEYEMMDVNNALTKVTTLAELDTLHRRIEKYAAQQLAEHRFAEKVTKSFDEIRRRLG